MGAQLTRGIFLSLGQCRTWLHTLTPTVFHGQACFLFTFGIIKPRLWWDSNPQPLNHCSTCLTRSPMRYPLRHRACIVTQEFSLTWDSTSWPRTLPTWNVIPELILTLPSLWVTFVSQYVTDKTQDNTSASWLATTFLVATCLSIGCFWSSVWIQAVIGHVTRCFKLAFYANPGNCIWPKMLLLNPCNMERVLFERSMLVNRHENVVTMKKKKAFSLKEWISIRTVSYLSLLNCKLWNWFFFVHSSWMHGLWTHIICKSNERI